MEPLLFNLAYVLYTTSVALYLVYLFTKTERLSRIAYGCLAAGLALHVGSLLTHTTLGWLGHFRSASPDPMRYVPWSNWFESLSFFAAIIALIFFLIQWEAPLPVLGAFIMPVSWLLMTYALFKKRALQPLLPMLRSPWLAAHIPILFTSYSLLGIACAVGVAYLLQERQLKSKHPGALAYRLPSLDALDRLIFRLIVTAFPLLTVGIVLGGVWAYQAWGRFWSWDPKETAALITWLVYLCYLMLRRLQGWRGRKTAYLSLAGFAFVLFTYAGVNYMSPLHGFLSAR